MKKLLLLLVIAIASSCAGFEFDSEKSIGFGGTIFLSNPTAVELLIAPSSNFRSNIFSLTSGYNRSFELSELDKLFIAMAYRRNIISVSVGFSQLGNNDYYSERTVRLTTGCYYRSFTLSMSYSNKVYEFGSYYEKLSGSSTGLGIGYSFTRIAASVTIENMNNPKLYGNGLKMKPNYNLYTEMIGFNSYSITGRIRMQEDQKPQLGLGQRFSLSSASSIFWGFSTAPTIYGCGVEINYKGKSIDYAVSVHPALGLSQTISISIDFDLNKSKIFHE